MKKRVVVIGGGVAGMQAALTLRELGAEPLIIEKEAKLGGKVTKWHKLFPSFTPAEDVVGALTRRIIEEDIEVWRGAEVVNVTGNGVTIGTGERIDAGAVVVASGFDLFDAGRKEEYGYGIYDNIFTSVDLEEMFNTRRIRTAQGNEPKRVAFLHCVGSRDEKVGAHHCSKVCCITGVKQAIEVKEMIPGAEVYNFYMDIRMFGPGYEELYREAQIKHNINFIRGRISEASQTIDGRVQVKAEDTLIGRPLKMTVDMLILVVGMKGGTSNAALAREGRLSIAPNGFMQPLDPFLGNTSSETPGIFYAGTVTAPKNIGESLNEGTSAAQKAMNYINNK